MDNTKNVIFKASLSAIGGLLGLKLFDFSRGENSSLSWYFLNGFVFFVAVVVREYYVNGFKFSLNEPQDQLSREENLRNIYSKRTDSELAELIANDGITEEAKVIAQEILNSRLDKKEA